MPPPPLIHPVPDAQLTWVFGLLEMLEDRGGREDGYKIARDLSFKFSDLLKVMKAEHPQAHHPRTAAETFAVQLLRAAAARPGR